MVHVHTLPDLGKSVINIFNLEDMAVKREIRFRPADIGLPSGDVKVDGAAFVVKDGDIQLELSIPARGHRLVKIRADERNTP